MVISKAARAAMSFNADMQDPSGQLAAAARGAVRPASGDGRQHRSNVRGRRKAS
jgi:hypothetical protein